MPKKPSRIIALLARHEARYFRAAGAHTEAPAEILVSIKGEDIMDEELRTSAHGEQEKEEQEKKKQHEEEEKKKHEEADKAKKQQPGQPPSSQVPGGGSGGYQPGQR